MQKNRFIYLDISHMQEYNYVMQDYITYVMFDLFSKYEAVIEYQISIKESI